jgi:hypothetical protein
MATQPAGIPLKQLVSSVQQAVTAALERHGVQAQAKVAIGDGLICGPLLAKAVDMKVAQQIAEDVAGKAHAAALSGSQPPKPGVFSGPNHIICGIIIDPREGIIVE